LNEERESEIAANLDRARESVAAAETLAESGYFDFAAARAYYAAFYAATAALLARGVRFARHSGVIRGVHLHFVKSGELEADLGRNLNWLSELRLVGDYGETRHIPESECRKAIAAAKELVEALSALAEASVGRDG
jgi:uncharacterized protein (UPF0332 family)